MAFIAIGMAIRGAKVYLYDPSVLFSHGANYTAHRHFADVVIRVARENFPDYDFTVHRVTNTLRCMPRIPVPVTVAPAPVAAPEIEFDDDGSDENR